MPRPGLLNPLETGAFETPLARARAEERLELTTPALVLGEDATALGAVRCLGRAGIRPYVLGGAGGLAARSRWARSLRRFLPAAPEPSGLSSYLAALPLERAVLTPCSDAWCEAVAALPAAAAWRFPSSLPPIGVIRRFADGGAFHEQLVRSKVPHAGTILVRTAADLDVVPGRDLPRYFLKPCQSPLLDRRFRNVFPLESREDAATWLRTVEAAGLSAVLQEYVPGPATSHYFLDGFVDREGRVTARFACRRLRMYPTDLGDSSLMVSVPLTEVSQAVADLDRLLADVGYRGIFSAEFKLDERDGALRLLQVTTRASWYVEFAALCGIDLCRMAHRDALGLPVESITEYRLGARFVSFGQDVRAFLALRHAHTLGLADWARSVARARTAILRWNDPVPALARSVSRLRGAASDPE